MILPQANLVIAIRRAAAPFIFTPASYDRGFS